MMGEKAIRRPTRCQPTYCTCGSDGPSSPTTVKRYLSPRNILTPSLLHQIAQYARANSIVGAAREYDVARQTVRRAMGLFGAE